MIKAYLSRVGADKGNLGCLGPLFKDYSFDFIPIDESLATIEDRTYTTIEGRSGKNLSSFIPKSKRNLKPHFDPEFETFTYGDPTTDREKFLKLNKGDILLFYAGLDPLNFKRKTNEGSCYFIGYFTVKKIIDFANSSVEVFDRYPQLWNNAHLKRREAKLPYLNGDGKKQWCKIPLKLKKGVDKKIPYLTFSNGTKEAFSCRKYLEGKSIACYEEDGYDIFLEPGIVIVIGEPMKSRLLEKAIPFTEPRQDKRGNEIAYVSKEMEKLLGISGYVQRKKMAKSAEVIQGSDYIGNLKELLNY